MATKVMKSKGQPFCLQDTLCILAAAALLVVVLGVAVLPKALGYTPYVITSRSMEPTLHRGDLVFMAPVTLQEVEEGDIISFRTGDAILTHRIYSINRQEGTLRTKADASDRLDTATVQAEDLMGRAVYRIPQVGKLTILVCGEETEL